MSNITFEGSPDEYRSPFCKENERICHEWESYVLEHNGKVKGKYTAWALIVKGTIKSKNIASFEISKSIVTPPITPTTNYKTVIEKTKITCSEIEIGDFDFEIRKYKISDAVLIRVDANRQRLNENLVIKIRKGKEELIHSLIELVKELDAKFEVAFVKYDSEKRMLSFEFNSLIDDFDYIEKIIKQ